MDLVHRFSVQAPIDEAWYALNHIDRLAPCFPGASIDSFVGDEFTGSVKIKFGPTLNYRGSGTFLERDDDKHHAVVEARGSDLRGGSGLLAKVTVQMWENGRLTDVEIKSDVGISGRPAQLGRGVIEDVSNKLMLDFVDRLQDRFDHGIGRPGYVPPAPPVAAEPAHAVAGSGAKDSGGSGTKDSGGSAGGSGAPVVEEATVLRPPTTVRSPNYGTPFPRDEPTLNVLSTVLPSILKRYGVFLAGGGLLLWVIGRIALRSGRRSRGKG